MTKATTKNNKSNEFYMFSKAIDRAIWGWVTAMSLVTAAMWARYEYNQLPAQPTTPARTFAASASSRDCPQPKP